MSIMKYISFGSLATLLLALCWQSCSLSPVSKDDVLTISISSGKSSWTDFKTDSLFEYSDYIVLEATEQSLIKKIDKIYLADNRIYVLDGLSRIIIFDRNGHFLSSIDHHGNGPGEYLKLQDFDIVDDTLFLLDSQSPKILKYSTDNTFLGETKSLKAKGFLKLGQDRVGYNVEFGAADGVKRKDFSYALQADDNIDYALQFNDELLGRSFSHSGALPFYSYQNDKYLMSLPFNQELYYLDSASCMPLPLVRLDIANCNYTISNSTSGNEIEHILKETPTKILFSIYNWNNDLMVGYESADSPFVYAIVDLRDGRIKVNQPLRPDKNGLPVMPYAYISASRTKKQLLSVVDPLVISSMLHVKGESASELLKEIATTINDDSNPVLVFYNYKV